MATASDVFVSINNEKIKLEGKALQDHLADQAQTAEYEAGLKKIRDDKQAAKLVVLEKLGITVEEAALLLQ
tara:strand:+ start:920 stop:1132 length:213 start_codon:yes stop_codon:yes gene_type:complete